METQLCRTKLDTHLVHDEVTINCRSAQPTFKHAVYFSPLPLPSKENTQCLFFLKTKPALLLYFFPKMVACFFLFRLIPHFYRILSQSWLRRYIIPYKNTIHSEREIRVFSAYTCTAFFFLSLRPYTKPFFLPAFFIYVHFSSQGWSINTRVEDVNFTWPKKQERKKSPALFSLIVQCMHSDCYKKSREKI